MGLLRHYLPILAWAPTYSRASLPADAIAGLSVWALLVPQSLAYATLVGVPVQYGLYTAFAALLAYAVFGPSRILVLGPDSALAAVILAVVLPLSAGDPQRAVALACRQERPGVPHRA